MEEIIWQWKFIKLVDKTYMVKSWTKKKWEYVTRTTIPWISSAAATLLEDKENDKYILVEEYRVPIERRELWLIAWITDENIPTHETIIKEVGEEAWRIVIASKFLETVASSAWLTNEETDVYHSICKPEFLGQQLGDDEDIKIHEIKTNEIDEYLMYAANDLELRVGSKIDTALRYIRAGKGITTNQ